MAKSNGAKRIVRSAARKTVRKASKSGTGILILVAVVVLIIGALIALYMMGYLKIPGLNAPAEPGKAETETKVTPVVVYDSEDLVITFMELGNWYTGDCTFIKAGDCDILIDAGSRENSVPFLKAEIDKYCTDGKLEYVIVTHAHQDHIAGFAPASTTKDGIFDLYECGMIIDFALTNATSKVYESYCRELQDEINAGAKHMTAREVRESGEYVFTLSEGITMTILDNYYYYNETKDENDYSVCCLINQGGDRNFLFTGDLEEKGEAHLVEMNDLPKVNLFKGGHHGSYTANTEKLLSVIRPDIVCICCCAFNNEYTKDETRMFPAQDSIDRIAKYTDRVYVTTVSTDNENKTFQSLNGTIHVISKPKTEIEIQCTGEQAKLKDTTWFKTYRTLPEEWKDAA